MMLFAPAVSMLEGFEVNRSSRVEHCMADFSSIMLLGDGFIRHTRAAKRVDFGATV
eukprot:TRINITY_DN3162_c0_g1_i1.p3 TRINITY_DN3162_c0_g1~~TRINITY_DN3162_c0_g1_i1.p3  ORF type:complete len:56 (-),score=6.12 TRINITY_DN3162_c0_g1_i1:131-298(-)